MQTIEDLTVEKETMRQKYERELASLKQLMEERVSGITSTLEGKLAAAERQHNEERDKDRKAAAEVLVQTKQARLRLILFSLCVKFIPWLPQVCGWCYCESLIISLINLF